MAVATTTSFPVPALESRATHCAAALREAEEVLVVSHIDADGLTSAAIAARALQRADIAHGVIFENQLDADVIERIAADAYQTVLFTDFGSGQLPSIVPQAEAGAIDPIVVDHHQPADVDFEPHLNPLLAGIDGATELSGAGATYLLARALGGASNRDLAALAVVGALGDRQETDGELIGANASIAEEGVDAGVLDTTTDLALYGRQTRPLPKLLAYAGEIDIPGITGDRDGAARFLDGLDADLRRGDEWARWVDLSDDDRQTVASELLKRAITRGVPAAKVDRLVGTTYTLVEEAPGTVLRDATEFSTLLNATARYDRADVGLAVCLGDRGGATERAQHLLQEHRRNLSSGVEWVRENGVTRMEHCQWFHAGDAIRETIVGIVAGMAVGVEEVDRSLPIIAFAEKGDDKVKVSARATPALTDRGVDLSVAMHTAATTVDGEGGGHTVAAGATIPAETEETFLETVDAVLGEQQ